jgi:BirA family transcriptional regulator, biotin operon repressor / biotin---[acetyl-CoA-carboxylase] ligase
VNAQKIGKSPARVTDRMQPEELRRALRGGVIGREIVVLQETSSTNNAILERTSPSTREGLVIFAERQTSGRGQRSNIWESAAHKGLWFSFLLRPGIDIGKSPQLAEWAARVTAQTICEELNLPVATKLPNDVLISGKKVAGVLVEMRAQKNEPHVAIVGIGVNVNHRPEDFSEQLRSRAISLAIALDRSVERQGLCIALLRNLDRTYRETFGLKF